MNDSLQKYVEAATGISALTKAQAEKIVKQMVKQGEAARDQAGDLVEDLLSKSRENREQLAKVVKAETRRVISSLGLASQGEVDRLNKQVSELKRKVAQAEQAATAAKPSAKKSAAKKTAAKKSAAKKSAAKKSAAKKSAAKKTPAKKTAAKKSTAKKSAAKKTPAKKSAAKKSAAKKSTKKSS